ncbi:unnamed protein product [Prorocentrum cordatum]|uniref:Uncharacterized protein n=1 Tax=Prorocentrum cordatum TaxID=2364126 RepID=A0ABN9RG12_9DINO|nr:unnamed protein product [Polarella glacialis]
MWALERVKKARIYETAEPHHSEALPAIVPFGAALVGGDQGELRWDDALVRGWEELARAAALWAGLALAAERAASCAGASVSQLPEPTLSLEPLLTKVRKGRLEDSLARLVKRRLYRRPSLKQRFPCGPANASADGPVGGMLLTPHGRALAPFDSPVSCEHVADIEHIEAGHMWMHSEEVDGIGRGLGIRDIAAPWEVVFGQVTDLKGYVGKVPMLSELQVYSSTARGPEVVEHAAYKIKVIPGYWFEYFVEHHAVKSKRTMLFYLDYGRNSDFQDMQGRWFLEAFGAIERGPDHATRCVTSRPRNRQTASWTAIVGSLPSTFARSCARLP